MINLGNGGTSLLFESTPTYPDPGKLKIFGSWKESKVAGFVGFSQ